MLNIILSFVELGLIVGLECGAGGLDVQLELVCDNSIGLIKRE